jgi:hypothetical protein
MCEVDGKQIRTMAFKGTGVCCELCRKKRAGEVIGSYILVNPEKMNRALAS